MSGYDDHLMCNLFLVLYFSYESRLCYYYYKHVNGYERSCVGAAFNELLRIDDPYPYIPM